MGGALVFLLWTRFFSPDAPDSIEATALNIYFFPIWAGAYFLAATTVPLRRSVIGAIAFGTALIGPLTSSAIGLLALFPIWWMRRSARILSGVLEDDGIDPLNQPVASAPRGRKKRRGGRDSDAPPGMEELAAVLRASDPSALVPFLSHAAWSGATDSATEPLLEEFGDTLLLSLGWDTSRMVVIGDRSLLTPENKRTALANLRSRATRAEWVRTTLSLAEGETDVWMRLGDAMTASDLWDREFVRAALALSGAPTVFIAVPTREAMVMSTHPDPVARFAMARVKDPEHGEHVLGTDIFVFDGSRMFPIKPMRTGEAGPTIH